jgi:hypothetical protein
MANTWNDLRPWNGSQEFAFEELCCQLAGAELYPDGSRFFRKGAPDAGIECFWRLPAGDEHGWQAKFFQSPPTPGRWVQLDRSVQTALRKHPKLTQYTVCMPVDRSDARLAKQKSFLSNWDDRLTKWKGWAARSKMSVEFAYWGASELLSRLSNERNRGRRWFWFGREELTIDWFCEKLEVAIAGAGPRYTPELNVNLPISECFDALGRVPAFYDRLNALYAKIGDAARNLRARHMSEESKESALRAEEVVSRISDILDGVLVPNLENSKMGSMNQIPWDELLRFAGDLCETLDNARDRLRDLAHQKAREAGPDARERGLERKLDDDAYRCLVLAAAARELSELCEHADSIVTNRPALMLIGDAGQGKTHLLCDVAVRDNKAGRPRILLHGSHFNDGEPWSQIRTELGLTCSTDEFIGALESAAQAFGCRIVILIDALNEGAGRTLWKKFLPGTLTAISRRPWLGIALSVRSSYVTLVVPEGLVPDRLTRIVHHGFQEHEFEAVHRFFAHFGIQPTIPLLLPEFTNPLFLKLFCQSMRARGLTQVPVGERGITAILEQFLHSVDTTLSTRLDCDPKSGVVQKAVMKFVECVAESDCYYVTRDEVVELTTQLHATSGYQNSLFHNLVSEGVLSEHASTTSDGPRETVHITYERFADHLLASHLLDRHVKGQEPRKVFGSRGALRKYLKSEAACWQYSGLIEALSVQIPERFGCELIEVAPTIKSFEPVKRAFIRSLVWRDAHAFGDATFSYLNSLMHRADMSDDILNSMLTVAPIPEHPLNAERLHRTLSRESMPNRDQWWSIFLHNQWQQQTAVDRLVEWAWSDAGRSLPSDEIVLLAGTALAWFLTSSNRFLRDRATKALVKLFDNKIILIRQLLAKFWNVDDPYVIERLVAVAYGCAMRSTNLAGLAELANEVVEHIFRQDKLLPHLLTRDYARGVVEFAKARQVIRESEFPETIPTYGSKWPAIRIPSRKYVEIWGVWKDDASEAAHAQSILCSSIMSQHSDFSRYVVGKLHEWTRVKIGTSPPAPAAERFERFQRELGSGSRTKFAKLREVLKTALILRSLGREEWRKHLKADLSDEALEERVATAEVDFLKTMRSKPDKLCAYREFVRPYIENPSKFRLEHAFDAEAARRWMVQRVIDYGWSAERFGWFDRYIRDRGRAAHKAERIGKKYQWIAYHELLARLADNFYLKEDTYANKGYKVFRGVWDIGYGRKRDIDPSVTIRAPHRPSFFSSKCWWSPASYTSWRHIEDNSEWVTSTNDLPSTTCMLRVERPLDLSQWLVLNTAVHRREPAPPGRKDHDIQHRQIQFFIQSYLLREAHLSSFLRWAKRQRLSDGTLPQPPDLFPLLLGELYWSPGFLVWESEAGIGWRHCDSAGATTQILPTCLTFAQEGQGYDCSVDEPLSIDLLAPELFRGMRLNHSNAEGSFVDAAGRVVAFDPSVNEEGPGALLARPDSLGEYLSENKLVLIWTVQGEKQVVGYPRGPGDPGWLEIDEIYTLTPTGPVSATRSVHRSQDQTGSARSKRRRPKDAR